MSSDSQFTFFFGTIAACYRDKSNVGVAWSSCDTGMERVADVRLPGSQGELDHFAAFYGIGYQQFDKVSVSLRCSPYCPFLIVEHVEQRRRSESKDNTECRGIDVVYRDIVIHNGANLRYKQIDKESYCVGDEGKENAN